MLLTTNGVAVFLEIGSDVTLGVNVKYSVRQISTPGLQTQFYGLGAEVPMVGGVPRVVAVLHCGRAPFPVAIHLHLLPGAEVEGAGDVTPKGGVPAEKRVRSAELGVGSVVCTGAAVRGEGAECSCTPLMTGVTPPSALHPGVTVSICTQAELSVADWGGPDQGSEIGLVTTTDVIIDSVIVCVTRQKYH